MKLAEECHAAGFTINDLSEFSGVPLSTLHDWKKTKPDVIHLMIKGMEVWINDPERFSYYGDTPCED